VKRNPNSVDLSFKITNSTSYGIDYFKACCELSRMAKYGIPTNIKNSTEFIDKCNFCDIDIKPNYNPIWYVNTPKNDFFLCNNCGQTIGEKTGDSDIFRCYKFQKWRC
jgi:hypothetical protein